MDPTNLRPDQLVTNVCLKATLSTLGLVDDSSVERLIGVYKIVSFVRRVFRDVQMYMGEHTFSIATRLHGRMFRKYLEAELYRRHTYY